MKTFTEDDLYKLSLICDRIEYAEHELRKLHEQKQESPADKFKPNPATNKLRNAIRRLSETTDLFQR